MKRILIISFIFIIFLSCKITVAEVFYFDGYDETWPFTPPTSPGNLVDGSLSTYASFAGDAGLGQQILLDSNTIVQLGSRYISRVFIRIYGGDSGGAYSGATVTPLFSGSGFGSSINIADDLPSYSSSLDWTPWYEITNDTNAPEPWNWQDVFDLSLVVSGGSQTGDINRLYKVEIEIILSNSVGITIR